MSNIPTIPKVKEVIPEEAEYPAEEFSDEIEQLLFELDVPIIEPEPAMFLPEVVDESID